MAQEFESFLNNLLLESTMNSEIQDTLNDFEKIVQSNVNPGDEITPEQFAALDLKGKTQYVYKALLENIAEAKSTGRLKEGEDLNALGILGQILLETGNFKSILNTKYFNFGGHKADKWWKANGGEFVSIAPAYGESKKLVDWRVYSSLKEGLKNKIDYFIDNSRYRKGGVMQAKTPGQHLLATQKAGYAGTEENYAKLSMERVNKLPELLQGYDENIGKDWATINPASDMEAIEAQRALMAQQNLARKNNQPIPEFQPTVLNPNIQMNSGPAYPRMEIEMPMEIPQDNQGQVMYGSFYNDPKSKQDAAFEKQVEQLLAQPIKINRSGGYLNLENMMFKPCPECPPIKSTLDPNYQRYLNEANRVVNQRRALNLYRNSWDRFREDNVVDNEELNFIGTNLPYINARTTVGTLPGVRRTPVGFGVVPYAPGIRGSGIRPQFDYSKARINPNTYRLAFEEIDPEYLNEEGFNKYMEWAKEQNQKGIAEGKKDIFKQLGINPNIYDPNWIAKGRRARPWQTLVTEYGYKPEDTTEVPPEVPREMIEKMTPLPANFISKKDLEPLGPEISKPEEWEAPEFIKEGPKQQRIVRKTNVKNPSTDKGYNTKRQYFRPFGFLDRLRPGNKIYVPNKAKDNFNTRMEYPNTFRGYEKEGELAKSYFTLPEDYYGMELSRMQKKLKDQKKLRGDERNEELIQQLKDSTKYLKKLPEYYQDHGVEAYFDHLDESEKEKRKQDKDIILSKKDLAYTPDQKKGFNRGIKYFTPEKMRGYNEWTQYQDAQKWRKAFYPNLSFAMGGQFDPPTDPPEGDRPVTDMYSDFDYFFGRRRRRGRSIKDRIEGSKLNMFGLMNPYNYGTPIRFGNSNMTSSTYFSPMSGVELQVPFGRKHNLNAAGLDQYGWSLGTKVGFPYDLNRTKDLYSKKALEGFGFGFMPSDGSGYTRLPYTVSDDQVQSFMEEPTPENVQSLIDTYNTDINELADIQGYDNIYATSDGPLYHLVDDRDELQRRLDTYNRLQSRKNLPYFGAQFQGEYMPIRQPGGFKAGATAKIFGERDPLLGWTGGTGVGLMFKMGKEKKDFHQYRPGTGSLQINPQTNISAGGKTGWNYGINAGFDYKPGGWFKNFPGHLTGSFNWTADPVLGSGSRASKGGQYYEGKFDNVQDMVDYYANNNTFQMSGDVVTQDRPAIIPQATDIPTSGGGLGALNNISATLGWTIPLHKAVQGVENLDTAIWKMNKGRREKREYKEELKKQQQITNKKLQQNPDDPYYNPGIRTSGEGQEDIKKNWRNQLNPNLLD